MDKVPTFPERMLTNCTVPWAISISTSAPRWLPMEVWAALTLTGIVALALIALTLVFIWLGRPFERRLSIERTLPVSKPSVVMQSTERTCMICLDPITGATRRELDCGCLVHVDCIHDWWRESAKVRPRQEVESGILQLDCLKCGTQQSIPCELHEVLVVTKGELLCADL